MEKDKRTQQNNVLAIIALIVSILAFIIAIGSLVYTITESQTPNERQKHILRDPLTRGGYYY